MFNVFFVGAFWWLLTVLLMVFSMVFAQGFRYGFILELWMLELGHLSLSSFSFPIVFFFSRGFVVLLLFCFVSSFF